MPCPPSYEEQKAMRVDQDQQVLFDAIQPQRLKLTRTKMLCHQLADYFNEANLGDVLYKELSENLKKGQEHVEVFSGYNPSEPRYLKMAEDNESKLASILRQEEIELCILNTGLIKIWSSLSETNQTSHKELYQIIREDHLKHRNEDRQCILKAWRREQSDIEIELIKNNLEFLLQEKTRLEEFEIPEVLKQKDLAKAQELENLKNEHLRSTLNSIAELIPKKERLDVVAREIKRIEAISDEDLLTNRHSF